MDYEVQSSVVFSEILLKLVTFRYMYIVHILIFIYKSSIVIDNRAAPVGRYDSEHSINAIIERYQQNA